MDKSQLQSLLNNLEVIDRDFMTAASMLADANDQYARTHSKLLELIEKVQAIQDAA